ncbi:MAG: DUF427 domain-containing protein [Rhodospirillales bacterium]
MTERRIGIAPYPKRVRAHCRDTLIADSGHVLRLEEEGHKPVYYFPRADVAMTALTASAHRTRCPYKGEATYYSIQAGGETFENAVWSYEAPIDAVSAIEGYLAFYSDKVRFTES